MPKKKKFKILNAYSVMIVVIIALVVGIYFFNKMASADAPKSELTSKSKTDRNADFFIGDDTIMGDKNAPVIIAEFGDFMCPFCGEVHREIEPLWRKEYIDTGKALYVFRDFISANHPQAYPAAEANECADRQGKQKQWQMYDLLFDNAYAGDKWTEFDAKDQLNDAFKKYAAKIGLNMEQFSKCMENDYFASEINSDISAGLTIGVSGTPTIFIGNDQTGFSMIKGAQPYSVYKQIIDGKLNGSGNIPYDDIENQIDEIPSDKMCG